MRDKEKSTIQELLVTLYLRLNGYFTTGFLIHSPNHGIETEIDILAIRFPRHKQDYTEHNSSIFLEVPDNIDVIIAEVKARNQPLKFNNPLRQKATMEPWYKTLEWIGIMTDIQVASAALELNVLVQPKENAKRKNFLSTNIIRTQHGDLTIRPIIFSPERASLNNSDKFINWSELNDYIWLCLCPSEERSFCKTRYDFTSWGYGLNTIVTAYKNRQKTQTKYRTISELYKDLSETENNITHK
ncbi:MAG: hypothetical protein WAQ28_01985 [Bacteroidia bacterium]